MIQYSHRGISRIHTAYLLVVALVLLIGLTSGLVVHLAPHSHADPGWEETISEYYRDGVSKLLDSVTEELTANPSYRFVWAEIAFFSMWWNRNSDDAKQKWRKLLENKQVEFVIGGWVMSDNAVTTYSAHIDQMTLGHRWLKEQFGDLAAPRAGWDIDTYGASKGIARVYQEMGLEYHVIARLDQEQKKRMRLDRKMEFSWKIDHSESLLTHVMYDGFRTPDGFRYEAPLPCCEPNIHANPPVTETNVAERALIFSNMAKYIVQSYPDHGNLLLPLGDELVFRNASLYFNNMTMIVNYINSHPELGVTVKYSTVSEYFDTIQNRTDLFSSYNHDFQPASKYASTDSFVSGFFTSRPHFKQLARTSEHIARSTNILTAIAQSRKTHSFDFQSAYKALFELNSANAIAQHHDALPGTSTIKVTQMYYDLIYDAWKTISPLTNNILSELINKRQFPETLTFDRVTRYNLTRLEEDQFVPVILFNSLAWDRNHSIVTLRVNIKSIRILDLEGNELEIDLVAREDYFEVSFEVKYLPALGYNTIFIDTKQRKVKQESVQADEPDTIVLSNSVYEVTFCTIPRKQEQRLCRIKNKKSNVEVRLDHQLLQYMSNSAHPTPISTPSDAYVFRPMSSTKYKVSQTVQTHVEKGKYVQQVRQIHNDQAEQTIRLYNSKSEIMNNFVEIEYTLGPIDINREVVAQVQTDIKSYEVLYTDDNGFISIPRVKSVLAEKWLASNYNPTQYYSYIKDETRQLSFISEHSHGVTSLRNGHIEYMLHRRLSASDIRDIQPLDDTSRITFTLRLVLDTPERSSNMIQQAYLHNFPVDVLQANVADPNWSKENVRSVGDFNNKFIGSSAAVSKQLPANIHLLTLEVDSHSDPNSYLFRLHNIQQDESPAPATAARSKSATVDLNKWFKDRQITKCTETSLSGTRKLLVTSEQAVTSDDLSVTLASSQIRTFNLEMQPGSR